MDKQNASRFPFYPQVWDLGNWHSLGFKNESDANYWQDSSCGILCIKMGIEGITNSTIDPISVMIKKGLELNAYTHEKGWDHQGLVRLASYYGVEACAASNLDEDELVRLVDTGCAVVVSVKWAFIPTKSFLEKIFPWKRRGGHLALVVGYDQQGFYVNHTSTDKDYNWERKLIPFDRFQKAFTGRGVVLSANSLQDIR